MRPHVASQAEGHDWKQEDFLCRPLISSILIIKSPAAALQRYGHLPHVAVSFLGRHASNAASEGCHSVAKLVMSDKQMAMSPSTFSKFVMLRHSKLAIAALKAMYKDEAQHVAHDITAKLCALPLDRAVAADS